MANIAHNFTAVNGEANNASDVKSAFDSVVNGLTDGTKDISVANVTVATDVNVGGGVTVVDLDVTGIVSMVVTTACISSGLISATHLATGSVTQAKLSTANYNISNSSGTYAAAGTGAYAAVSGLSATITSTGRPIWVVLQPDGTSDNAYLGAVNAASHYATAYFSVYRSTTLVGAYAINATQNDNVMQSYVPPGCLSILDAVTAGTYTYLVKTNSPDANNFARVYYCKLVARET